MERWSLRDFRTHLALTLPAILWCSPQLFLGRVAYFRDSGLYFQPHKALIASALREGRLPEWNPFEYGGMPLLADPNFNTFHPLSLLTDFVPLPLGFALFALACALSAAYGARALGRCLGLGQGAALACGLFFAWSGPTVSFLLTGQVVASAFLPWLCAAGAHLGRAGTLRAVLLCAVAAALQLLSGTPEVGACAFALAGLLALSEALAREAGTRPDPLAPRRSGAALLARPSLQFLLAAALGAGLASIQLLPSALFLRVSSRAGGFELAQALSFSLHPLRLLELLFPFFTGDIDGPGAPSWILPGADLPYVEQIYLGSGVLLLAALGLRTPGARRRWPMLALALLWGVVAFGKYLPGGALLWESLPLLRVVRFPEKLIVPLSLAAAVSAGAGWARAVAFLERISAQATLAAAPRAGPAPDGRGPLVREAPGADAALVGQAASLVRQVGAGNGPLVRQAPLAAGALLALALLAGSPRVWLAPLLRWPEARFTSLESGALASIALEALLGAAALLVIALAARGRVRSGVATGLFALLLVAELSSPALRLDRTASAEDWTVLPALPAILEADAQARSSSFRISSQSTGLPLALLDEVAAADQSSRSLALFRLRRAALFDSSGARAGVRADRGYSGFTPGELHRLYTQSKNGEALDLLSVRYGIDFGGGPSLYASLGFVPRDDLARAALAQTPALAGGAMRVFENRRALPGAWLAPAVLTGEQSGVARCSAQVVPWLDPSDGLRLPADLPRGATCAALAQRLAPATAGSETVRPAVAGSGRAIIETFQPEQLGVRVEAPAPSLLVLSENALPGWRAFVDGVETAVLHADGALRACAVPAGQHRVIFRYATPGLRAGAWVSAASAALFALLLARSRRRSA